MENIYSVKIISISSHVALTHNEYLFDQFVMECPHWWNLTRGFHKHTTLAIMPILASEALQCENQKNPVQNVTPSGN